MLYDLAVNKNLLWDNILNEGLSLTMGLFVELLLFIYFIKEDYHLLVRAGLFFFT